MMKDADVAATAERILLCAHRLTREETDLLAHALGLHDTHNYGRPGRKRQKSHRNGFLASQGNIPAWDGLVERGLAVKTGNGYYSVTKHGETVVRYALEAWKLARGLA